MLINEWNAVFTALAGIGSCVAAIATVCAVIIAKKALSTWKDEHRAKDQWKMILNTFEAIEGIDWSIGMLITRATSIEYLVAISNDKDAPHIDKYGENEMKLFAQYASEFEKRYNEISSLVKIYAVMHGPEDEVKNSFRNLLTTCNEFKWALHGFLFYRGQAGVDWGERFEKYRYIFSEWDPDKNEFIKKFNSAIAETQLFLKSELKDIERDHHSFHSRRAVKPAL